MSSNRERETLLVSLESDIDATGNQSTYLDSYCQGGLRFVRRTLVGIADRHVAPVHWHNESVLAACLDDAGGVGRVAEARLVDNDGRAS